MACGFDRFRARDLKKIEVDVDDIEAFSVLRIFAVSSSGDKLAFELTSQHLETIVEAARRAMVKFRADLREH
jgi:DNA-binding FrmR family transcriptional regulator